MGNAAPNLVTSLGSPVPAEVVDYTSLLVVYLGGVLLIVGLTLFLFIRLALLGCRLAGWSFSKRRVALAATAFYVVSLLFFFTGLGPFVGEKQMREYQMTWEVNPPSNGMQQAEVMLKFVDYPGHSIGVYSDILATHLRGKGQATIKMVCEVTLDYGSVRYYSKEEIAGLKDWDPEWGFTRVENSPERSPWD